MSDESGKNEVYVRPFPGPGGKWQVSVGGGSQPKWRRDGRELFYLAPGGRLMAVEVKTGQAFESGTPVELFEVRLAPNVNRQYDVSPDGQRFLVNMIVREESSAPITLVVNWKAGLKP